MKPERLLRAILPDVLIDNFDIVNFDKSADRFDIYLDEKKVQLKEDRKKNIDEMMWVTPYLHTHFTSRIVTSGYRLAPETW